MDVALRQLRAATRFGLGVRPADPLPEDPVGAVRAELARLGDPAPFAGLPTAAALVARRPEDQDERRALEREVLAGELAARVTRWRSGPTPAVERVSAFFANLLTVSRARREVTGLVGAYEREAIRANLGGRFEDLLLAAIRHPAMLAYLDQVRSVGPTSPAGQRRGLGLNENLAREILELHTLGVDGGYTQADVEAFARVLTGWTVDRDTGAFRFEGRRHEPGARTVVGVEWPDEGEATGVAVLRHLARHPATARRLARRIAVHWLADDPDPTDIGRIEEAWRQSGGHLPTVFDAVAALESAWSGPPKLRSPHDFVVAMVVALPVAPGAEEVFRALERLGQPWAQAPSPAGWPDGAEAWIAPDALVTRIELAHHAAGLADPPPDAAWAERLVGAAASPELRAALPALDDRRRAALVFASPEFQRR